MKIRRKRGCHVNNTLEKQNKFVDICSKIAVVMIGLIIGVLAIASILQTSRIDPQNPGKEIILFQNDAIPVNLALIVLSLLAFIALMRKNIRLSKVDPRFVIFLMLVLTTIIPLAWINLTQSIASGDARTMLDTAKAAAQDNYDLFQEGYYSNFSYYQYYPSQLGYVFFAEIIYRIFGAGASDLYFQIPNVIALDFAYAGIVMITGRIFKRPAVTNMTAIALALCLQPMLMTTYTSPMILGLAFAVWSVYFTVRYMQEDKLLLIAPAALLITIAVVLRYNNVITLTAISIVLSLHMIGKKRFLALIAAAVMVTCPVLAHHMMIFSYEERSGATLNTEVTPVLTAYMGISESTMAPGWFNWNGMTTLRDSANSTGNHQPNNAVAETAAWEGIGSRLDQLSKENALGDFIKKKFLSQFNEPFLESVWISQTRAHNIPEGEKLPGVVTSVYTGGLGVLLDRWFPYCHMMICIGFAAGMVWLMIRRRLSPEMILLPVTVLGGILYHMLCEAKSQYFLPYFVLLIPFAMYGLLETTALLKGKTELLFRKQQESEEI